jgi:hypothetical protein
MLFALVAMAGVVLLVAVVNNRREPSRWDSRLPQRKGRQARRWGRMGVRWRLGRWLRR